MTREAREAVISKQQLLKWHRWVGAVLALFLTLQGLSGASLVFRDELEPLLHSELIVTPREQRQTLQSLEDRIEAALPDTTITRSEYPESENQAVLFKLKEEGSDRVILAAIDPYSGAILKSGGITQWPFEWMFWLHYGLLAGETGHYVIGFEGLALLFIAVTGPIVWWPGRRKIRQGLKIRWKGKPDLRWRTLHRSAGAIVAIVLVMSATTGSLIVWKDGFRSLLSPFVEAAGKPTPKVKEQKGRPHVPLDSLVAEAQRSYGTPLRQIRYSSGGRVIAVYLDGDRSWRADGTSQVYYNVYDGKEVGRYVAGEMAPASEFIDWLFTVHTGLWGGFPTKLLMLVTAISLVGLSLTGPWLWWSRTRGRRRRAAATPPSRLADDAR